ncbi:hypothetical protein B0H12DRAFT_1245016 [Mycena haematopus]|nr:hypothetical protein B0H12DRAFT_1245016 [Mycena haematopus]
MQVLSYRNTSPVATSRDSATGVSRQGVMASIVRPVLRFLGGVSVELIMFLSRPSAVLQVLLPSTPLCKNCHQVLSGTSCLAFAGVSVEVINYQNRPPSITSRFLTVNTSLLATSKISSTVSQESYESVLVSLKSPYLPHSSNVSIRPQRQLCHQLLVRSESAAFSRTSALTVSTSPVSTTNTLVPSGNGWYVVSVASLGYLST